MATASSCKLLLLPLLVLALPWTARAAAPFIAAHAMSSSAYQAWVQRVVAEGYRLEYVNGYDAGGAPEFAAVALKTPNAPAWEAHHDLSAADFRKALDSLAARGFEPSCVSGYQGAQGARFAAIWVRAQRKPATEVRYNLTSAEYNKQVDAFAKRGMRPGVISGYGDGAGSYRLAVLFVAAGQTPWIARHDLTADEYQKLFDEWQPKGYRPASVAAYPAKGGVLFAAVLVKDATPCVARHGMSAADYQAEFTKQATDGFRPVVVTAYGANVKPAGPEVFDQAMRTYMAARHIRAGTLAVSRDGKMLLQRGYGFADAGSRRKLKADDPFRIASVTKPFTAAAIRRLISHGKLSLDTRAFPLLALTPPAGTKKDPRLDQITIKELLEHKAGWDRDKAFDPMFRPLEISAALDKKGPASANDVVRYMVGQPLQFAPGSRECYSNFGYCVLGRVIEKVTGEPYLKFVNKEILSPLGIGSVELARSLPADRNPREPQYLDPDRGPNVVNSKGPRNVPAPDGTFYIEAMDSHGGLIASAPDLARFLNAYWISGEPRQGNGQSWAFFGSLPGTFTLVQQQPNGINVAALFNQRTDPSGRDYFKIQEMMRQAGQQFTGGQVRYAAVWVKEN
ncbi:MAG TPA: serine hydrolase [Tepidisphaeraceae bacterium]|nr:serine hydrolase [Tepidisphaeraceae bacterium]